MTEDMAVDDIIAYRGVLYRVVKVDEIKGLYLLEKRVPTEEMDDKVIAVITHTGWDILRVGPHKARLKRDNLPKRLEKKKKGVEEE